MISAVSGFNDVMGGRIAPVPDSLRFAPSNGAKDLQALLYRLENLGKFRGYSPRFVAQVFGSWIAYESSVSAVHARLRDQGNYLIQSGVR